MDSGYTHFFKSLLGATAVALVSFLAFAILITGCAVVGLVVLACMVVCLPFVPVIMFCLAAFETDLINSFFRGV